ncbi:MAG: hypothetical protein KME49_13785 [Brasilonema octagenarum HA4186-MV1]|nr:hypothetical protein [Brasilonema octagenarum HA4186-MV1]
MIDNSINDAPALPAADISQVLLCFNPANLRIIPAKENIKKRHNLNDAIISEFDNTLRIILMNAKKCPSS